MFLMHKPPHAFDDGVPVVDFAVLRVDRDVLHAGHFIGGDPVAHHADIPAVPVRAHRDRKGRLGPVAAQALDHFAGVLACLCPAAYVVGL
jgi:hypothetical protein